jgi:hypothetical protein
VDLRPPYDRLRFQVLIRLSKKDAPSVYTIRPRLPAAAQLLYGSFLCGLSESAGRRSDRTRLLESLLSSPDLDELASPDRLATRLFLEIVDDLTKQGWDFVPADDGSIRATAPGSSAARGGDVTEVKRQIREDLSAMRDEQLAEPKTRAFVRRMERPRWHRGRQLSVLDLFTDPRELAADLQRRLDAPAEVREALLYDAVQPYLQLVTGEADEHTGLALRDIWRYCRHTWSLPLGSQPGRRMHYLVRDAARPLHPIMGIGALGSSVVQITCRDERIGWTLDALREADDLPRRVEALEREIEEAIGEIYVADFVREGVLTEADLAAPSAAVLARLDEVGAAAPLASRERAVDAAATLEEAARSPLFRRKRALTLRVLLEAHRTFRCAAVAAPEADQRAAWLLEQPEGRRALRIALRSLKKRHVGASMMDITTCGAVPPYGPLLTGKLVALLMASPQVVADYQARYAEATSHIASRMRGAPVVRPSTLALLGTTSLHHVGSSQYNRLRAPAARGELRYDRVGTTKGFGTVHLSRRTYRTLQEMLRAHPDTAAQGYGFGNGVNYKIRSIATALGHLGLAALQKHENPRIVYLAPVLANWREYLGGVEEPVSIYNSVQRPEAGTEQLIDFWKRRWMRAQLRRFQRSMSVAGAACRASRRAPVIGVQR